MNNTGRSIIIAAVIMGVSFILGCNLLRTRLGEAISGINMGNVSVLNSGLSQISDSLKNTARENQDDSMSIFELGNYLMVNPDELRSMIITDKLGKFPYTNINGNMVFSRKAVNEWLLDAAKENKYFKP